MTFKYQKTSLASAGLCINVFCSLCQLFACTAFMLSTTQDVRGSPYSPSFLGGSGTVVPEPSSSYTSRIPRDKLDKAGGVLYRQSVFTNEEYSTILKEVSSLMTHLDEETTSSVAQKRLGAVLPRDSDTVRILEEGNLSKLVQRAVAGDGDASNNHIKLSTNLPVEVRLYGKVGAGMAWHVDDILYDPPQVEVVITLENSSDCVTMWKDGHEIKSKETDPNSALLLKAGGASHCVTSLKYGRRVILKCAYISSEAEFQEGIFREQFGTPGKKRGKKRKRKR